MLNAEVGFVVEAGHHDAHRQLRFDFVQPELGPESLPLFRVGLRPLPRLLLTQSHVVFDEVQLGVIRVRVHEGDPFAMEVFPLPSHFFGVVHRLRNAEWRKPYPLPCASLRRRLIGSGRNPFSAYSMSMIALGLSMGLPFAPSATFGAVALISPLCLAMVYLWRSTFYCSFFTLPFASALSFSAFSALSKVFTSI